MTRWSISRRALLASAAAWAAVARADPVTGSEETRLLVEEGRYLPLLQFYRSQAGGPMRWMAAQVAAMTGDEDGAFAVPSPSWLPVPDLDGWQAAPALETIVAAARSRRIVILNEAHHISRGRGFAGQLALRLVGEGFTCFAAETFDPSHPLGDLSGAVTPAQGWYLADPVYAEAVRSARRAGYRFAAYEAQNRQMAAAVPGREIETREDAEANNFIATILERDAKARVFVVCGYDHVRKTQDETGQLWFAGRLKAKTGIDPLCIAQDWGVPPPAPTSAEPALQAILDKFSPTAPIVLFDSAKRPVCVSRPAGAVDVEVIHPLLAAVDGRPGWLAQILGRKRTHFALTALSGPGDLIQAVPSGEAGIANAVPADQYPLKPGTSEAVFFLTPGEYQIRLENEDGRRELGSCRV